MQEETATMDTKERLLETACELFARKGYSDCSISDITSQAGANKAAINYHFGNKENLYQTAWRKEFTQAIQKYPIDGGVAADAPARDRLHGHIYSLLRRIADPNNREFNIIRHERSNPTGLLREVMRKSLNPVREHLEGIVQELLDCEEKTQEVHLCCHSIKAQCMDIGLHWHASGAPHCRKRHIDIDQIAEHIFNFSYAGIIDLRKKINSPCADAN